MVAATVSGFSRPWDIAFLPDGTPIVTERSGRVATVVAGARHVVATLADVEPIGEGGLMGLAVDPAFGTNRWIYTCYDHGSAGTVTDVRIVRFRLAEDLRSLKGIAQGDMIEVYRHSEPNKFTWDPLAVMHLNIYVTARFWWDVNQDLDALLDEYYRLFYGPAEKEMKAFIEYSEANWPLMSTKVEPIDKALALLAEARKLVG